MNLFGCHSNETMEMLCQITMSICVHRVYPPHIQNIVHYHHTLTQLMAMHMRHPFLLHTKKSLSNIHSVYKTPPEPTKPFNTQMTNTPYLTPKSLPHPSSSTAKKKTYQNVRRHNIIIDTDSNK